MVDHRSPTQTESLRVPSSIVISDDLLGDQTCHMEEPVGIEMAASDLVELLKQNPLRLVSRQERDFALASLLIRSRHMSERSLRDVLKRWTPFGSVSLRDFLISQKLVTDETLIQVEQKSNQHFQTLEAQGLTNSHSQVAARTTMLMDLLDPSGSVAKLFGIFRIPKLVVGDESRTFRSQFRLVRKVGQGGLGTVWLAVDLSLNRYVAVKEITSQVEGDSAAIARFRREAEITGRLDHPSIVPIHLLGENEQDGRVFYVMRFLGNETLADAIREYHERRESGQNNSMAFHRLLTAFVSICQAIAYAHSNKVIHRDLKPQNIALDNFGQVIVLDWGLAKSLGLEDPRALVQNTVGSGEINGVEAALSGQVVGTPMYMAPEQASGRLDEIDERTDVYGLGAILFSILTGYAPHERSHETLGPATQMTDLMDVIIDHPNCRPRTLNSQIPKALEAICLKAIAKDRYARYESASALSDDVQRWLANEPVSALQDPLFTRMQRWMTTHPKMSQALTVGVVAVLILLVVGLVGSYQTAMAREQTRHATTVTFIRDLRERLTSDLANLADNTRFMSELPPIRGIIDARRNTASSPVDEAMWAEQLRVIYKGLIDVHPNYTAITYWLNDGPKHAKPIRVENSVLQRGMKRTDLTEFFGRHLPRIMELAPEETYLGIPGRLVQTKQDLNSAPAVKTRMPEIVGHCIFAGVAVHDKDRISKLGGVGIECDLESILSDFVQKNHSIDVVIFLTDDQGRCLMRFTRDGGLKPIDLITFRAPSIPMVKAYFLDAHSSSAMAISPDVCVAKVPLSRHHKDEFMGIIAIMEQ